MTRISSNLLPGAASAIFLITAAVACGRSAPPPPAAPSGAAAFDRVARDVLQDHYRRHPTHATDLGIHAGDAQLEDDGREAVAAELDAMRTFRAQIAAIDSSTLDLDRQLDREQLIHALDSAVLTLDVIKPLTKDPDRYSSGITNAAYVLMKRNFAPPAERLKSLIARERKMVGVLEEARRNLDQPPRIYTEIAIEQIDGNRRFFQNDVPAAFSEVKDEALINEFRRTNGAVVAALGEYKTYLEKTLLGRSNGTFALGAETYVKLLAADETIDLPLDRLLDMAEDDRRKNDQAFVATARTIDATKSASQVLAAIQRDRPAPDRLLKTTQDTLDSLRQFITDHHIVTIPTSEALNVSETPPFRRSTTTASMDTPGPFETVARQAYYYMTLPDPRWSAARQADYMKQWYLPAIVNVSVHEVYPGHYLQFLYDRQFPSDVRRVYGTSSNIEGWAHYAEQMMLDEGFHADDPRYRLAQLQDALLRDIRFIVGIKMHTQGLTVDEATKLFVTQAYQPEPVARQESKRGTSDPTYGYYTMGKLMILKLRDDYKAKQGVSYTLQGFHDAFIKIGPLALPLVRRSMLGETGQIF